MDKITELNPKWDWIQCSEIMQTVIGGQNRYIDLKPQITLTHPDGPQYADPTVKLCIDIEKQLNFTEVIGWNWIKNQKIPNILIKIEIKESSNSELILPPKNLYAQLFAAKAVLENPQTFYLVDVGLTGISKMEMHDGYTSLSQLKFSQQSDGVKFHLVLCIYIQDSDTNPFKVITTTISPPILVINKQKNLLNPILLINSLDEKTIQQNKKVIDQSQTQQSLEPEIQKKQKTSEIKPKQVQKDIPNRQQPISNNITQQQQMMNRFLNFQNQQNNQNQNLVRNQQSKPQMKNSQNIQMNQAQMINPIFNPPQLIQQQALPQNDLQMLYFQQLMSQPELNQQITQQLISQPFNQQLTKQSMSQPLNQQLIQQLMSQPVLNQYLTQQLVGQPAMNQQLTQKLLNQTELTFKNQTLSNSLLFQLQFQMQQLQAIQRQSQIISDQQRLNLQNKDEKNIKEEN